MNRKVATSSSSEIDDPHRTADSAGGEAELRSDSTQGAQPTTGAARSPSKKGAAASRTTDASRAPGDVGQLLRGAYRQTVDEAIPDDLMDLLNKLE